MKELLIELEAREEELQVQWDRVSDRLAEEDIIFTPAYPELDEEYHETWGRLQELKRTRELLQKVLKEC